MLGRRHEGGRVGCHSPCSDFRPAPTLPQLSPHVWRSQTPGDIVRRKPLKSLGWSCPLLPRRKSLCTPTAPRPVRVLRCWFQETVKALMHQSRRDEGGGSISIMVEQPPLVARPASALDFALPLRCRPERKSPATLAVVVNHVGETCIRARIHDHLGPKVLDPLYDAGVREFTREPPAPRPSTVAR